MPNKNPRITAVERTAAKTYDVRLKLYGYTRPQIQNAIDGMLSWLARQPWEEETT